MTSALDAPGTPAGNPAEPFRDRLLDGLAASIGERGYRDSTVADIVRHARTSKRTFYEQFASKEECLIELLRRNNEDLITNIVSAVDREADWHQQIRQAAIAYVDHIASRPAITLSWIREAPALGAAAGPLHRLAMEHLTDMLVDLIQERIDLAIRIAELSDSTAIVRKLANNRRLIVAAPEYLERRGTPQVPEDLLDHNCLLLRFPGSKQYRWTLKGPDGPITLRVSGNMDCNSGEALRDWCLAGHGLALKSLWEVVDDLNDGRLVPVLTDYPPPSHGIYALYPHSQHAPPRVRVFIDFLAEVFGAKPSWEKKLKLKLP